MAAVRQALRGRIVQARVPRSSARMDDPQRRDRRRATRPRAQEHPLHRVVRALTRARSSDARRSVSLADLLAIDKPSGISLLADRSGAPCLWDTLRDELAAEGNEPLSIHRIDKGTSGVLAGRADPRAAGATDAGVRGSRRAQVLCRARARRSATSAARTGTIDLPLAKGRKSRYRIAAPRDHITRHGNALAFERTTARRPRQRVAPSSEWVGTAATRCSPCSRSPGARISCACTSRGSVIRSLGDHLYGKPDAADQRWPRLALHCHRLVVDGIAIEAPTAERNSGSASTRHPTARRRESGRGRRRAAASTRIARRPRRAPPPIPAIADFRAPRRSRARRCVRSCW